MEDPVPSSNTLNVSIATIASTKGSGTINKNRHPVMVKDETAMTRPMEDLWNSRVLKVTHGAEPRLNDLTLTSAQRMEWTRQNLAGTHPRPGPMPAKILRKFKQQAVIMASGGGHPAIQLDRIKEFGPNALTDDSIKDEEEDYPDRRDLLQIQGGAPADIKTKLACVTLASEYTDHGTWHGLP